MSEFVPEENISMASIVMAIGVGGGGGNAVNHLYTYGDKDVSFMLCNTDKQALINSPVPDKYKIQLGTDGLGAGNDSSSGRKLAEESTEQIKEALISSGIKMAFVVAGMGGGTGTGAAPVIARVAKELGILTIGVVTIPFEEEGRHRIEQAIEGVDELSKNIDSLIIINNAHIVEMYGDLGMSKAYYQSNEIVAKAVKSISNIINKHFVVNVDFADVCKVMRDSGVALMGTGRAEGEDRAIRATEEALTSPLLHNQDIKGAKNVLVCMLSSEKNELKMSDSYNVPKYIQDRTKTQNATDIIWGAGYDNSLEDTMEVSIIATGFNVQNIPALKAYYAKTLGNNLDVRPGEKVVTKTNIIQFGAENEHAAEQKESGKINFEAQDEPSYSNYRNIVSNTLEDSGDFVVKSNPENVSGNNSSQDSGTKIIFSDDQPVVEEKHNSREPENPNYTDDPDIVEPKPRKPKENPFRGIKNKFSGIIDDIIAKKDDGNESI